MILLDVVLGAVAVIAMSAAIYLNRRCRITEDRLEAANHVIELANDPVLVADLVNGRIVNSNPAARRLLGYGAEELLQKSLPELHPTELAAKSAEIIADVWEKKGLVYSNLPLVNKQGEHIAVEISANVFQFHKQPAMLIFARDIRVRRQLEAQLVQSEKMAALGQLVAGVAHEINTPIGSIHSTADVSRSALDIIKSVLQATPMSDEPQEKKMQRALKILDESCSTYKLASERIVEVVRSLKNFSRLDEAERKEADLHEGIDTTLTLLRHELKHGIKVVKNYSDLPKVDCLPNQLNQVFMNILVNAVHAMEGKGTITITTENSGDAVTIKFADTGKGIPKQNLQRIFDPGFTSKGVGVGTGLGLSISYQIIEKHGGAIEVESEVGKGSTFTIRIPRRRISRA